MDNYNNLLDLLPEDIIEYIYSIIYYKQNKILLDEIKTYNYIKKKIINNGSLKGVLSCAIIHSKNEYSTKTIKLTDLSKIEDYINLLPNDKLIYKLNNIIAKLEINKKYSFIFYMSDVRIYGKHILTSSYIENYVKIITNNYFNIE